MRYYSPQPNLMRISLTIFTLFVAINCFATGQQTFGTTTLRSPFLNMNKCYDVSGSATINPQGVINPTGTVIQWGTATNLATANTISVTNPTSNSYDTTLYVKVTYNSYILLDTVKLSFVSSAMAANFVNNSDICVEYPNNTYLDLSCTVTGLGNTTFAPYWSSASNYCLPYSGNSSNANNPLEKTYWVFTPTVNVATVTLKNTNGCVASNTDTFTFNLKQAGYSPFSNYDTLIKCGSATTSTYANQPPQTNVSFAWSGVYSNNGTTTSGLVTSNILSGTSYQVGTVIVTNNTNGCVNTYQQVYDVRDISMSIGGTYSLPCNGDSLTITDTNYDPTTQPTYLWSLTGNAWDYSPFIAGVTFDNGKTLKAGLPTIVYSNKSGTIPGETGTGTQYCSILDTVIFIAGSSPVVTGITPTDLSNKTYSFSATGVSNATTYSWDFGDGNSSTDVNPTHTYNTAGSYTVKITVTGDDLSCGTDETTYTLNVTDQGTGINSINNESSFTLYPNPIKDKLTIQSTVKIKSLKLITPTGTAINLPLVNIVDLLSVPAGLYYIQINDKYQYKIVKE